MRWLWLVSILGLSASEPLAEDRGASGLWQSLRKLQTTARVLHIVAHPDDEDGATLAHLSRGLGAQTVLLSLTRGESGANLVTGDFFDRLGALRTAELLRAAQYYGVEAVFTRAVDYGYSKNVAETFRQWDRRAVLGDMVRAIRHYKPHVILSRWQGSPRDGHGNHEAAGILAREAFVAAADAAQFPEAGEPWQAAKLYSNNRNALDDWTVRIDNGMVDPALGRSYAQIAREGLRQHRSQGIGAAAARPGQAYAHYKLLDSKVGDAAKEQSFFERVDIGLSGHPEFARHIDAAVKAFRMDYLKVCAPHLREAMKTAPESHKGIVQAALAQALGLELEARVESALSLAVPGQTFNVSVKLHGATATHMALLGLPAQEVEAGRFRVTIPADARFTKAHWSRGSIRETSYTLDNANALNRAIPPWPLRARVSYAEGTIEAPVLVESRKPLAVAPPISLRFSSEAGILPMDKSTYEVLCIVASNLPGPADGSVKLELPAGWNSEPAQQPFRFAKEKDETTLRFRLTAPARRAAESVAIRAIGTHNGRTYSSGFLELTQPGYLSVYLAPPAVHAIQSVDVKVAGGLKLGYVMGTGDAVPDAIRQLGVPVDRLGREALANGDLSSYSAILLGIRAYAVRDDLRTYNQRLLEYVEKGGVLIVQYNTPEFDNNYGPFPYVMGRNPEEISEEDSPVTILDASDAVFRTPNPITVTDFQGWVEQRGSKFLSTWDPRYKPLIATNDSGQAPQKGGWLTARHGKGLYIYCAYAWYRQLPYAVPGAARLFANLISLGAADSPWRAQ